MGERSKIEWTDATFNPWWGCVKVSPGCDNCYAERDAKRHMPGQIMWGADAVYREFGDAHWNRPLRWDRTAAREQRRMRVFCASMADVFDNQAPEHLRERLWQMIADTQNLDWLLLTKRISNAARMLPPIQRDNVWVGISVVNQEEADRDIPKLTRLGYNVQWLSIEPMLAPIDLTDHLREGIDWVVVGGESGWNARPMQVHWARDIATQCAAAGVPFFFKQGSQANWPTFKDFTSFPIDLQRREFPYCVVQS